MASRQKDIALNILADIRQFQKEAAKIPGATEEQAAKAAFKMQAQFAKAARVQARDQLAAAEKSRKAWDNMAKAASVAMAGIATAKGITSLADMRQNLADLTNELGDTAAQTDVNVETLNALRVAAESSGGGLDKLVPGLRQFPKKLDEMARGTGEARVAFERLGITQADAAKMLQNVDGALKETLKRVKEVPDLGMQATMATQLWGESGVVLNQVLGNNSIDQWVEAAKTGVDVSEDAIRSGQEWQIVVSELQNRWMGFTQAVTTGSAEARHFTDVFTIGMAAVLGGAQAALGTTIALLADTGTMWKRILTGDFQGAANVAGVAATRLRFSLDDVSIGAQKAAITFQRNTRAMLEQGEAGRASARALAKTTEQQKKATDAARAHAKAMEEQERQLGRLDDLRADISSDGLTDDRRAIQAAGDRFLKVSALLKEGVIDAEEAEKLRTQITDRKARDRIAIAEKEAKAVKDAWDVAQKEINQANADASQARIDSFIQETDFVLANIQRITDSFGAVFDFMSARRQEDLDQAVAALEELQDKRADKNEAAKDAAEEQRKIEERLANDLLTFAERQELERQLLEAQTAEERALNQKNRVKGDIDAAKKIADDEKRRMRESVIASRAAAIFDIGVSTAVAVMQALAQLGPIAGAVAAGTVTAAGITQAALVAAEPMPSFFGGGRVPGPMSQGEAQVRVHGGEGFLNAGAMDNLGQTMVDALNAGMEPLAAFAGSDSAPVVMDGRVVGQVMGKRARRAGPLREALRNQAPVGFKSPFGRN